MNILFFFLALALTIIVVFAACLAILISAMRFVQIRVKGDAVTIDSVINYSKRALHASIDVFGNRFFEATLLERSVQTNFMRLIERISDVLLQWKGSIGWEGVIIWLTRLLGTNRELNEPKIDRSAQLLKGRNQTIEMKKRQSLGKAS